MAYRNFVLIVAAVAVGCHSAGKAPETAAAATEAPREAATEGPTQVMLDGNNLARVRLITLRAELAPETVEATGRIVPAEDHTWRIGAVVEGRIEKTQVEAGDRVKAGQLLAGQHSHDIHDSRANYQRATSEKRRAEESLAIATRQRDRAKRLFELRAGSSEQVDAAEGELVRAQAAVRAAEVEISREHQHITEILQVSLDAPESESEDDLIPIKAPAPGVVLRRLVTTGTVVTAGQELFVVADLSRVLMIAQVPEAFLARLRIGQAVSIRVQAYPDRVFSGKIERIAEELDPETRTIQARIALANPAGALKPESYATASIPVGAARPALFLPSSAVQDIDGAASVFVAQGQGKFSMRPVALGRTINDRVEVTDGLAAGEQVAIEGAFLLKSQLLKARLGE